MDSSSPAFRIAELSRRTGVTVPTLRAWEIRYRLLRPARTVGGQRLYSIDDERRIAAVLEMTAGGVSVGAAARSVAAGSLAREGKETGFPALPSDPGRETIGPAAPERPFSTATAAAVAERQVRLVEAPVDGELLTLLHEATRSALQASTPQGVAQAVQSFVTAVGAQLVEAEIDDSVLPVDVAFGEGPPLLPRAEPFSLARLRLEQGLPELVEDARRVIRLLCGQKSWKRSAQ